LSFEFCQNIELRMQNAEGNSSSFKCVLFNRDEEDKRDGTIIKLQTIFFLKTQNIKLKTRAKRAFIPFIPFIPVKLNRFHRN
jgi:hypothetical protein